MDNKCHCHNKATWLLINRRRSGGQMPLDAPTHWAACDDHVAEAARMLRAQFKVWMQNTNRKFQWYTEMRPE